MSCHKKSYSSTLVETAVAQGKCREKDGFWWSKEIIKRERRFGSDCMKAAHREHYLLSMVKSLETKLAAKASDMAFVDDCWKEMDNMTNEYWKKQLDEQHAIMKQKDSTIADQAATIADKDALLAEKDGKIVDQASALRVQETLLMAAWGVMTRSWFVAQEQTARMYSGRDLLLRMLSDQEPFSPGSESIFEEDLD